MKLNGIHHVSCITGDAQLNVDFYTRVLGMRLVKKTVNQDDPSVYHLFYADDQGNAGADLTFFEYPHAVRGRAGAGMIHTVVLRVASRDALDFWQARLEVVGELDTVRRIDDTRLAFNDPEGLGLELAVVDVPDAPLTAARDDIPDDFRIQGFDSVRAYATRVEASRELFEQLLHFDAIAGDEATWDVRGATRGGTFTFEPAPEVPGRQGAGVVHHVAWAVPVQEHAAWATYLAENGVHNTPVIDRHYFKAIYFREPNGVLFEIADVGSAGFAVDEDPAHLGEKLSLPPKFEPLREQIEPLLTPIVSA
ncbi:MAG: VOC family protein [Thermoleophilia bacterium]|nr:VOC family protein [Thermoleophilia bacterium]